MCGTPVYCREDEDMARQLVELGFRGTSAETMKREEFEGKKRQLEDLRRQISKKVPRHTTPSGVVRLFDATLSQQAA